MRSSLRTLFRKPAFAIAAVVTIALAVGANTALFSVIYAVLIQPLPFRDPGRLVQIWETHPALPQLQVTVPDFQDFRNQAGSFEQIAAYTLSAMNTGTLLGQGEPELVHATMAGSDLFTTMGIRPLNGRAYSAGEERRKEKVALLSESLWHRKFASDPNVAGRMFRLDQESFRIVGVVPQNQAFPAWADLWIPLSLMEDGLRTSRKYHPLELIGRLRAGVAPEQAGAEIQTIGRRLAQAHPETSGKIGAYAIPLSEEMTGTVRPSLLLAWAAVGLVLLMACANLAHLFLARMSERRHEMSVRAALGAKTWHLVRQVLDEAILVSAAGGAAGVAVAAACSRWLREFAGGAVFDGPVWYFAGGILLIAGVLFALPAVWQIVAPMARPHELGRSIVRGRSRFSGFLIAAEVAMAVLVLGGLALLTRNFAALLREDPGFRAQQVLTIPNLPMRKDPALGILPALRAVPGVTDIAAVNSAPMSLAPTEHSRFATRFGIEGRTVDPGGYPVAQNRWCTPEYFRVLGIPVKSGRALDESDLNQPRVVVNETLARRFFPGQDAVGKRILLGVMDGHPSAIEIVGVAGDVRDMGLDREVEPTIYSRGSSPVMTLLIRTSGPPEQWSSLVRQAIHRFDPELAVGKVELLDQNVAASLARRRFVLTLLAIFGAMAAFLTAAGLYALIAQSVSARVREFGVRAAVGASPGELVRMILLEAIWLTVPGLAAGLILSLAFGRVMKTFVYQLSPIDPLSIASAVALLMTLAVLSSWLPAQRAARVDPAAALRAD